MIGKQWMWHLQHPEGPREINELHVPVGVPVKLTMTSQDVIHDFYIPAFRVKKDVLPGRYYLDLVPADRDGHVPSFLRAILRHEPLGDDRLGVRDVANGLCGVARGWREDGIDGGSRASACTTSSDAATATRRKQEARLHRLREFTASRKRCRAAKRE